MECSICGVKVKYDGPAERGTGRIDVCADGIDGIGAGAEEGGTSEDGGASDLFPLALRDPLKVTDRSSRFQKFFLMYAKLMAGLNLSWVKESKWTPRALHKAVIRAGIPSLEESCWAMSVI